MKEKLVILPYVKELIEKFNKQIRADEEQILESDKEQELNDILDKI